MEQQILHGQIEPNDIANSLIGHFNRGNYTVQQIGKGPEIIIQIATRQFQQSGGKTAVSVTIRQVADGISVEVGRQAWLGIAASLGASVLTAIKNPLGLINRLDDIAQDIESLQITEEIWEIIQTTADSIGAGKELSDRLRRMVCEYCETANPVGAPNCVSCGAPMGGVQPKTCAYCGFVLKKNEKLCPNCKRQI